MFSGAISIYRLHPITTETSCDFIILCSPLHRQHCKFFHRKLGFLVKPCGTTNIWGLLVIRLLSGLVSFQVGYSQLSKKFKHQNYIGTIIFLTYIFWPKDDDVAGDCMICTAHQVSLQYLYEE
jgi:hypothetical protein